ncbi:Uncharacterized membrane protein YgdD, TMEM256/DUF423 family [Tenacibaculum sp. MAR_2009_124]|uniref:DUF423 domain-containing protein n=1 Tax=Tenacibaculum sp. MAR_2009_124 TaxID=1250059 RepID=UPI000895B8FD|nr:DUF423 domain-containing protein [Tenacibaculum sp. MAR_2009_124]SED08532.1 Uncharacterized membrane protein YgdD, TMEM256/DUF423 family [Tenacibaculum sp. MAR_2009_124]
MYKNITISSVLGAIAVILGAFGAHALKSKLSPEALNSFETAVRYQIYHVLLLLFVNLSQHLTNSVKNKISITTFIGILFFSGSIYCIHLLGIPAKSIWFITPLGGVFLIIAWFMVAFNFSRKVIKNE